MSKKKQNSEVGSLAQQMGFVSFDSDVGGCSRNKNKTSSESENMHEGGRHTQEGTDVGKNWKEFTDGRKKISKNIILLSHCMSGRTKS